MIQKQQKQQQQQQLASEQSSRDLQHANKRSCSSNGVTLDGEYKKSLLHSTPTLASSSLWKTFVLLSSTKIGFCLLVYAISITILFGLFIVQTTNGTSGTIPLLLVDKQYDGGAKNITKEVRIENKEEHVVGLQQEHRCESDDLHNSSNNHNDHSNNDVNHNSINKDGATQQTQQKQQQHHQEQWPANGFASIYVNKIQKLKQNEVGYDNDDVEEEYDDNWSSSSSTSSNSNYHHNHNMTAVVHIGPHKTGSTTIQYIAQQNLQTLLSDHYEMPHTFIPHLKDKPNHGYLAHCLKNELQIEYDASIKHHCDSHLLLQVVRIGTRKQNVLITAERLASYAVQPSVLYTLLAGSYSNDNIRIVAYYRRFYEWLLSWNNELNKRKSVPDRETIVDWITNDARIRSCRNTNYVSSSTNRYRRYFQNVIVYNMHDPNYTLSTSFFCSAIPNAYHTCHTIQKELALQQEQQQQLTANNTNQSNTIDNVSNNSDDDMKDDDDEESLVRNEEKTVATNTQATSPSTSSLKINAAVPFVYDELSYAAVKLKLVKFTMMQRLKRDTNTSLTSGRIEKVIRRLATLAKDYQEKTLNLTQYDFSNQYINCPPKHYIDKILQISIEEEQLLFPQFFVTPFGEKALRQDFQKMIDQHRFCLLNATAVVFDNYNGWKNFFTSLK